MGTGEEFALIEWLRRRASWHPRLELGLGDDAALLRWPEPSDCLLAADMVLEGVHFTLPPATAREVGHKALAVNLSDLAAMAAKPLAAMVTLGLSRRQPTQFAHEFYEGLGQLADDFHVALAGGDTNFWDGPVVVSVTAIGEATKRGIVQRRGARVGDWILATGEFGGGLAGKHLAFRPRVEEALRLHEAASLHAMIDVSDGLAADLHHILRASGVGAILEAEAIPISEAVRKLGDNRSPLEHALGDGEDFELVLTVSPEDARQLLARSPLEVPLSQIGEIVEGSGCRLRHSDGTLRPLEPLGWQHRR